MSETEFQIEFLHKTSTEFRLFRMFAEFIVDQKMIDKKAEKSSKANQKINFYNEIYPYLGLKIVRRSLPNKFSKAETLEKVFTLPKAGYLLFCQTFIDIFKNMLPTEQEKYRALETAFIQWKSNLDTKYHLIHDDTSKKTLEISIVEKPILPFDTDVRPDIQPFSGTINDDKILGTILSKLNEYYKFNGLGLRKHTHTYGPSWSERNMFEVWKEMAFNRITLNTKSPAYLDYECWDVHNKFENTQWEIFERDKDKILKRIISIPVSEYNDEILHKNVLDCKLKCIWPTDDINYSPEGFIFSYDIHQKSFSFHPNLIFDINKSYCFKEDPEFHRSSYNQHYIGHKICYNDMLDLSGQICVLRNVEKQELLDIPVYSEHDLNSDEVPNYIKTVLLEPNLPMLNIAPYIGILENISNLLPSSVMCDLQNSWWNK